MKVPAMAPLPGLSESTRHRAGAQNSFARPAARVRSARAWPAYTQIRGQFQAACQGSCVPRSQDRVPIRKHACSLPDVSIFGERLEPLAGGNDGLLATGNTSKCPHFPAAPASHDRSAPLRSNGGRDLRAWRRAARLAHPAVGDKPSCFSAPSQSDSAFGRGCHPRQSVSRRPAGRVVRNISRALRKHPPVRLGDYRATAICTWPSHPCTNDLSSSKAAIARRAF